MKKLRYCLEAALLHILLFAFKLMPPQTASNVGGWIGQSLGPRLAASRKALRNLKRALPDKTEEEYASIIKGMWNNLGRIVAEYPHLETLATEYTEIINLETLEELFENEQNAIFFGAHFGNWEINAPVVYTQLGQAVDISYRAPNNPYVDKALLNARNMDGGIQAHAKSREGGRGMMGALKSGRSLGILIDQKFNEGLSIPFFGLEAMTNPFFVQLAQKYKCPLIPIRNTRLDDGRFQLKLFNQLETFDEAGTPRPVEDVVKDAHTLLEEWIAERPEQWLWLHKRWAD